MTRARKAKGSRPHGPDAASREAMDMTKARRAKVSRPDGPDATSRKAVERTRVMRAKHYKARRARGDAS